MQLSLEVLIGLKKYYTFSCKNSSLIPIYIIDLISLLSPKLGCLRVLCCITWTSMSQIHKYSAFYAFQAAFTSEKF